MRVRPNHNKPLTIPLFFEFTTTLDTPKLIFRDLFNTRSLFMLTLAGDMERARLNPIPAPRTPNARKIHI